MTGDLGKALTNGQDIAQAIGQRLGNTLFVHGGLDPHADPDEFLTRPWTLFTEARWAWINHGFLDWKGGFGGILVVHGHTPARAR